MSRIAVKSLGYGMFRSEDGMDYTWDFGPDGHTEILTDSDGAVYFIAGDERDETTDTVTAFILK